MRYSHKARGIIIQYLKDSMKPVTKGEVLGGHQIASEGRIRRWFQDILEGDIAFIGIDPKDEAYTYLKLHYRYGWPWARVAKEYNIPISTLSLKRNKFFHDIVENMDLYLGLEILRIHKRHLKEEDTAKQSPRWKMAKQI